MERCPNCGAPAREGAKFCTTCGNRLTDQDGDEVAVPTATVAAPLIASQPEQPFPDPAPPLWRSAEATEPPQSDATLSDQEADSSADATANHPPPSIAADSSPSDDEPPVADQVLSSSWPASDAPRWSAAWGGPTVATTDEPDADSDDTRPTPAEGTEERDHSDAIDGESAPSFEAFLADASSAPAEGASPTREVESDDDPFDPPAIPTAAAADPDDAVSSPYRDDDTATDDEAEPRLVATSDDAFQPPPADAGPPSLAHALDLLDELRSLLPTFAIAAPAIDTAAIAEELELALSPDPSSAALTLDLTELRAAMENARDRPRDIDTVLDLSRRVDDVLALLDAHDRAVAAIESAAAALRSVDPSTT